MQTQKQDWENFLVAWAVYPRREARADAWKAWQQMSRTRPVIDELITTIKKAIVANEWSADRRRFIPLFGTWLRGQRWADEFEVPENVLPATAPVKVRAASAPQIDPAAAKAWDEVREAVRHDAMPLHGFSDRRTDVVLKQIGWTRLANMSERDLPFVHRDFVQLFVSTRAQRAH